MQQLKSSVQKGIRARLLELYPHLDNYIDQVLPKKDTFRIVKWYVNTLHFCLATGCRSVPNCVDLKVTGLHLAVAYEYNDEYFLHYLY